ARGDCWTPVVPVRIPLQCRTYAGEVVAGDRRAERARQSFASCQPVEACDRVTPAEPRAASRAGTELEAGGRAPHAHELRRRGRATAADTRAVRHPARPSGVDREATRHWPPLRFRYRS